MNRLEVLHEAGINLGAPFITEGDQGLTPLELASMLGKQDVVDAIHAIIFVDQA